jgi:hypothetical protein
MEVLLMGIEWFRDLAISLSGLILIGVLIFIAVLAFLLYRRVSSILDSMKIVSKNVQGISSFVTDEVAKPLIQMVAFVQGIRQGIDAIGKLFKRKKGEGDE